MSIRSIVSIGLLLIVVIVLVQRFYIEIQLNKIEPQLVTAKLKKKFNLFKQKELQISVQAILVILSCLVLSVLLSFYDQFRLGDQINQLVIQNKKMQKEMVYLNESQQRVELKRYPDEGIGLTNFSWDKIVSAESGKEEQTKLEMTLTEQLLPYLAAKNIILTIDVPSQTLSLSIITRNVQPSQEAQIQENITQFLIELNAVPLIRQVNLQLVKHDKTIENYYYARNKETEKFEELKL